MTGRLGPERATAPDAPPVRATGHERVDAVLARAAALDGLSVAEHPGHYEVLHAALLAELEAEPDSTLCGPAPLPGAESERGDPAPHQGAGPRRGGSAPHPTEPGRDGDAPHPEVEPGRVGRLPSPGAEPGWGGPR